MLEKYENLILGAGPAGLQLAYFFQKTGRDYHMVEAGESVGTFFRTYPRHRKLISINKVVTGFDDDEMNMRWDWNSLINDELKFTSYSKRYFPSADDLVRYLEDFAETFKLKTSFGFRVALIDRKQGGYRLTADDGRQIHCDRLFVATGYGKAYSPDFEGADLCEPYETISVDPDDYHGERVLIVGKGNTALEIADSLTETTASVHICSPNPIKLAWNTHYVGNARAVNTNFLDTYQLKSQNVVLDAYVERLERNEEGKLVCDILYTHAKGETRRIIYDRAIMATGFKFDDSIFAEDCRPETLFDGKLPSLTEEWESVNLPGMYFAGSLMHGRDFRRTMSGFIHGFRHNVVALFKMLEHRHYGREWVGDRAHRSPNEVALLTIDRLDRAASMFLQPGFFGDLLVLHNDGSTEWVDDVPMDYVASSHFGKNRVIYTLTLEYGDYSKVRDSFAIDRDPDPLKAHLIEYLHPILRKYDNGEPRGEFHLVEDLENEYMKPMYIQLLEGYFSQELAAMQIV